MSSTTPANPVPLWLDVDTGHDDAFALLLAVHSPNASLLGVTTVHGNASLPDTTSNTLSVLEAIGARHVLVFSGATKPLERNAVHAPDIHGESGLDGVTLLPAPVATARTDIDYVEAMYRGLKSTEAGTAWLVTTGTLTNAAKLFAAHPDIIDHIAGLSIMGGSVGGKFTDAPMGKVEGEGERFGNITAFAEFNIYCDPEAAHSIFSTPSLAAKTTLISLDLTHTVLATHTIRRRILFGDQTNVPTPSALRALFHETISFFARTYADVFALHAGPPLHDPLAAVAAVSPEIFDDRGGERFEVSIETEGLHSGDAAVSGQLGRTRVRRLEEGRPGVRIPRGAQVERFWEMVEMALREAEGVSPLRGLSGEKRRGFMALYED